MSSSRLAGIAMILTGLILWIGPASWLATRKLVVRDPPISLTRGAHPDDRVHHQSTFRLPDRDGTTRPAPSTSSTTVAFKTPARLP
jgi:hypothetical protein